MDATTEVTQAEQYLTFSVTREEYAVGILKVREIIRYEEVTAVPGRRRG